jgi:formate/nitrite transporter FocA (FNT family)
MIQVGIGITVGLLVSGMIWHFIRGKNGKGKAVFVF